MSGREVIEFHEGDVIVHSMGDEYESTWVRDEFGKWHSTGGPEWDDATARSWLDGDFGKLIHRAFHKVPVHLPEVPTLGWLSSDGQTSLSTWRVEGTNS